MKFEVLEIDETEALTKDLEEVVDILRTRAIDFDPKKISNLRAAISGFVENYHNDIQNFDVIAVDILHDIYRDVSSGTLSCEQSWLKIKKEVWNYLAVQEEQLKTLVLSKDDISNGRIEWDEFSFYGPKVAAAKALGSLLGISGRAMLKRVQGKIPVVNEVKEFESGRGIADFRPMASWNLEV
jgi:hypothetical protein